MNSYNKGSCGSSTSLAIIGGISSAAVYLGCHFVNNNQTGVDHAEGASEYSKDSIAVLNENELEENVMKYIQTVELRYFLLHRVEGFLSLFTAAHIWESTF